MSKSRRGDSKQPRKSGKATPYKHPVPDVNTILQCMQSLGVPTRFETLAKELGVSGERPQRQLGRQLKAMVKSGRLLLNRKDEFCLLEKIDGIAGRVSAHPDGFGFLVPEDHSEDLFLPEPEMRQLLDGDRVAVRVAGRGRGGKRKGQVIEILERGKTSIVGRFHHDYGIDFVVENRARSPHRYLVQNAEEVSVADGQMVKLEIVDYPGRYQEPRGRIIEVYGSENDPGMITTLTLESFDIPCVWPAGVEEAAGAFGPDVPKSAYEGREDLRELPLVTIDGADARDFDDAVFAEPSGEGWRLVVAIADVSHYVSKDAPLDKEARKRGTSVYFPDRVVPMLPEALSNGLCSLNPKVDRLCMVCDMHVTTSGKVNHSRFYRAVMRSHQRFTYEQVHAIGGEKRADARREHELLVGHIDDLFSVYHALAKARARRGALELELPEMRIELDENDEVKRISARQRNDAHKLIEECMIAANVEAAKTLHKQKIPAMYRVHGGPDPDKFEELRLQMQQLDVRISDQAMVKTAEMNDVLQQLQGRPDFAILAISVLKTMAQAVYQPAKEPHFGLALTSYTHFTSPIRRYPDLLVHRALGHLIDGGKPGKFAYSVPDLERLGEHCSMTERRAEEASRQVEGRYKSEYMSQHVGDEFSGIITGVTNFGIFVTLDEIYTEGLVHITGLGNDYFHLEHGGLQLTGERHGQTFALGDAVQVRVASVDPEQGRVDLSLANAESRDGGRRRRR